MGHPRALLGAVLVLASLVPAQAGQAPKMCMGKRATIVGTEGADRIFGSRRDDVIVGLGGIDFIHGGRGDDLICAGSGGRGRPIGGKGVGALKGVVDVAKGGDGRDRVLGGLGPDLIIGGAGDDETFGGRGYDLLYLGSGDDLMSGGRGRDTLDARWTSDNEPFSADLNGGFAHGSGEDVLRKLENLIGDEQRTNILIGNSEANRIIGGGGRDVIEAGGGHDLVSDLGGFNHLEGGEGSDRFFRLGQDSRNTIEAGRGNDTLQMFGCRKSVAVDLSRNSSKCGSAESTVKNMENVIGTPRRDVIQGNLAFNQIIGRGGNDVLKGGRGNDTLLGGQDDDTLRGMRGADLLDGMEGDDTLFGGPGSDACRNGESVSRCNP